MKTFVLIVFAMSCFNESFCQNSIKQNTLYFELGGNALFTSLNYERQVLKKPGLGFHIGAGIYGVSPSYLTIPLGINYLVRLKKPNSFLDLGFGATYTKADVQLYAIVEHKDPNYKNTNYWNFIPSLGYRRVTKKNMMYRFSIAPVINHNDAFPFLGFSIGKSF